MKNRARTGARPLRVLMRKSSSLILIERFRSIAKHEINP